MGGNRKLQPEDGEWPIQTRIFCIRCNNQTMDRLRLLENFLAIADAGSMSKAARLCGGSVATSSRQLEALEEAMGARLFDRTTRSMRLNAAGQRLYPHAQAMLQLLEDAHSSVSPDRIKAHVRVSAPVALGVKLVACAMTEVAAHHPEIEIDLSIDNRAISASAEGVDILVRAGLSPMTDSTDLVLRSLGHYPLLLCTSPQYWGQRPTPQHPSDLTKMPLTLVGHSAFRAETTLPFVRNHERVEIPWHPRFWSNDLLAVSQAVCEGAGVGVIPPWLAQEALRQGQLVTLLPQWSLPRGGAWVAWRNQGNNRQAVRLVVAQLQRTFAREDFGFQKSGNATAA
jgi:DNA-binding transcriptional LysR family regulator